MRSLLLAMVLAGAGDSRVIEDPRGFHFTVPEGFEPFPQFQPTATKLYAYGKNLGSPAAVTFTIDVLDGPTTAGAVSQSCRALMNDMNRTVGTPFHETWKRAELSGVHMVMTHTFGEVVVLCVDVPVTPRALSVMVSGKPANEPALQETFRAVLSSLDVGRPLEGGMAAPAGLGAVLVVAGLAAWFLRRRRAHAKRS